MEPFYWRPLTGLVEDDQKVAACLLWSECHQKTGFINKTQEEGCSVSQAVVQTNWLNERRKRLTGSSSLIILQPKNWLDHLSSESLSPDLIHMSLTKIEPQHFYSLLPLVVIVWLLWCNDVNVDRGGGQSGLPAPTLCFCFLWSEEIQQEDPHRRSAQPQEDVWKTQTRTSTETITDWLSRCLHLRYGTTNSTFPSTDHGNAHFSETE